MPVSAGLGSGRLKHPEQPSGCLHIVPYFWAFGRCLLSLPSPAVLSTNVIHLLIDKCLDLKEQNRVKLDAAWSLCNVFSQGTVDHADYLLSLNATVAIVEVLDNKLVRYSLPAANSLTRAAR